jgi:molybdopterin synthase sulfur carrier subunit
MSQILAIWILGSLNGIKRFTKVYINISSKIEVASILRVKYKYRNFGIRVQRKDNLLPTIWIPTPLRELTQGKASVAATGSTVREVIDNLESQFPGIKDRLCEDDRVRPNISVFVDGTISHLKMRERLGENSEVHFVIAISGG